MRLGTGFLRRLAKAAGLSPRFELDRSNVGAVVCGPLKPVAIDNCLKGLAQGRVAAVRVGAREVTLEGLELATMEPRERGRVESAIRIAYGRMSQ